MRRLRVRLRPRPRLRLRPAQSKLELINPRFILQSPKQIPDMRRVRWGLDCDLGWGKDGPPRVWLPLPRAGAVEVEVEVEVTGAKSHAPRWGDPPGVM